MVEKEIHEVEVQRTMMDEVRNEIGCRLMEGRMLRSFPSASKPCFVPASRQPTLYDLASTPALLVVFSTRNKYSISTP